MDFVCDQLFDGRKFRALTIVDNCRAELIPSEYIQTEEMIKQKMEKYIEENKKLLFDLLDEFIEKKNKRII